MNDQDTLLVITSKLDNDSLRALSKTVLWSKIREFCAIPYFWYLRTSYLVGRDLVYILSPEWKIAYYALSSLYGDYSKINEDVLGSALAVRVMIELGVDPSASDNWAIRWASKNGHLEVVRLLLGDKRVDPSASDNWAIRWASQNGHTEVVRLLLQDKRVDPSTDNNCAIRWASQNGHTEVVRLLLGDKRVDPSTDNNCAIRWASQNGHTEVVRLLEAALSSRRS